MATKVYDAEPDLEGAPSTVPHRSPTGDDLESIPTMSHEEAAERARLGQIDPSEVTDDGKKHTPSDKPGGEESPDKTDSIQGRDQAEEAEAGALADNFKDSWGKAGKEDGGSFYNPKGSKKKKGFVGNIQTRWKVAGAVGAGLGLTLLIFAIMFSFLNIFKLDHLISNIDAKTFARFNGISDQRSYYWTRSYMIMRLGEVNDPNVKPEDRKNIFRAERVDTGRPLTDWYRTMRASDFEQKVFEKNGIKFVSMQDPDKPGRYKPAKIIINDKPITIDPKGIDYTKIQNGDVKEIAKFQQGFEAQMYDSHKAARKDIKKVVQENTRFYEVMKRRAIRKSIQNMTGVRNWRFFEKTREKYEAKKLDIRDKLLTAALPNDTKSGKLLRCLFGLANCRNSDDIASEKNQASTTDTGEPNKPGAGEVTTSTTENGKTVTKNYKYDPADVLTKLLEKIGARSLFTAANVAGTLDMIEKIDSNIRNGSLSKAVVLSRGIQAAALYQVMATSRDQLKSGELSGKELSDFMGIFKNATNNEGYSHAIRGQGGDVPSDLDNPTGQRKAFCSATNQADIAAHPDKAAKEYIPYCPDKRIGGRSKANTLEEGYMATAGQVLHPIAVAVSTTKDSVLGPLFNGLVDLGNLFSKITGPVLKEVIKIAGLQDNLANFGRYMGSLVMSFLGGGQILSKTDPPGVYMNWLVQGASYTAESTSRQNGAALTTPASAQAALIAVHQMNTEQNSGTFQRYLALGNPDSTASQVAFTISDNADRPVTAILSAVQHLPAAMMHAFALPFSSKTGADAANSPYRAADYAGIETYDFPPVCATLDPMTATPQDGTNIQQVLASKGINVPDSDLTWDLVTDQDAFYKYLYSKTEDEDITKKVYNCHILDTRVRGGLGYLYGYTKDGGYQENTGGGAGGNTAAATTASAGFALLTNLNGYTLKPNEAKHLKYIAENVQQLLPGNADAQAAIAARVSWWSLKERVLNLPDPVAGQDNKSTLFAYNNCGGTYTAIADPCSAGAWQVGIAAVQVRNFTLGQVETTAKERHPGMTIKDILASVAKLAGVTEESADYNKVINATGDVRKSLLLRDPATAFTLIDENIKSECVDQWKSTCVPGDSNLSGNQATANTVIAKLKDYFSNPTAAASGVTKVDAATAFQSSTGINCAAGTKDLGIQDGYTDGKLVKIRVCAIPGFKQLNDSLSRFGVNGTDGNIAVNSRASGAVLKMFTDAKADGVVFQANSSFRTMAYQQSLCPCDGINKAHPGYSNHQMGLAIDFATLPSSPGPVPGNQVWEWLSKNADKYGYKNYPHEAWHWSPTGN